MPAALSQPGRGPRFPAEGEADQMPAPSIRFQGALFANHSLAHVNREICIRLIGRGCRISFTPSEPDDFPHSIDPRFALLEDVRNRQLERVDLTIRHQWPPDFSPVQSGRLVLIQPWEFGSLPARWIEPMNTGVDEIWVPSTFVRECFVVSGVHPDRLHVIPNGVDPDRFKPGITPLSLATRKRFRFLFVGGTIHRKGIDILLAAYHAAFTASDDVSLVIKDMGTRSFYEGQTAGEMISRFRSDPSSPEIEYIDHDLAPQEMAALYAACHCLVHPYRGEGFGLPIAEAMACGVPPIVTGAGAALDFCSDETGWLIPAAIHRLPVRRVGNLETVGFPWLAEPDVDALSTLMRHVVEHPDELRRKGEAAWRHIHGNFTWEHAADRVEARIRALTGTMPESGEIVSSTPERSDTASRLTEACRRAELLAQRGETEKAIRSALDQCIRIAPHDPSPYLTLVDILISAERHAEALQVLPEMPASADPSLTAEIEALCLCGLGKDEEARRAAERAGERPNALTVLGTLAARGGDLTDAERLFRRAISLDPSCGRAWLSLAMLHWGEGAHEEAWEAAARAAAVSPRDEQAMTILREMANRLDRSGEALRVITDACGAYPDSRNLARHHLQILAETGREADALAAGEAFLARFGMDGEVLDLVLPFRQRIGPVRLPDHAPSPTISLCMIVRDEERNLPRCLASAKPVVDEMVVVDTGSIDRTVDVASLFGAVVFSIPWEGDFASARNVAIDHARGDWILVLDADEVISPRDHGTIRDLLSSAPPDRGWSVLTRNYTRQINAQGWTANDGTYPGEESADGWTPSRKVRLFPRDQRFRFSGAVHEMVEPSLRSAGVGISTAPFVIHHYGELDEDPVRLMTKRRRYFALGLEKLQQNPGDMAALCELAVQAGELGEFERGIELWDRLLAVHPEYVEALFNKGYCLIGLHRYPEALECSRRVLELEPDHKEAALNYGVCELYAGDPGRAIQTVMKLSAANPSYPLLTALLAALQIVSGDRNQALRLYRALKRSGHDIRSYLAARADRLREVGRVPLAEALESFLESSG